MRDSPDLWFGALKTTLDDRRCLVVGTAPQFGLPTSRPDAIVAVNGAVGRLPLTTVHVVSEHLLVADTESRQLTLEQFHGKCSGVLVISGQLTSGGAQRLSSLRYKWDRSVIVPHSAGGDVVASACGGWPDHAAGLWMTTGLFAVCLAFWSGASAVIMAGYSLTTSGHFYNPRAPRWKCDADADVLRRLARHWGSRLSTTSPELHDTFGLALEA